MAALEGEWSTPEIINIVDIPPPSNVVTELISAETVPANGMQAFRVTMEVNWDVTTPPPPPERITKRQVPVREPDMEVTKYTIAIGFEPIEEPYGEIPMSSVQRDIFVSWRRLRGSGIGV